MHLLSNINQTLLLENAAKKDGRRLSPEDFDVLSNSCVIYDDAIRFVGLEKDIPKELLDKVTTKKNLEGFVLTPEIVDCHTHLIFGGNRSKEYSMRLNGADYQKIAQAGGGILESSRGTNSISDNDLLDICSTRIKRLNSLGVGTIEIKSGYGLGFDEEYRLSKLIHKLKEEFSPKINIINTYMAAHAVPSTSANSTEYIKDICIPLMNKLSGENIIDAVDIFHEEGYFNQEDVKLLFDEAVKLNLRVKSHADEFQDNDGAALAVEYNALSTDHLLCSSTRGIQKLSESSTVATLLPGTGFFLGKPQADARAFLDAGVKVAIGSDYNPGSCHCDNVLLLASLAAPHYRINITELWTAITLNASHALGLMDQGSIQVGMKPRFSLFRANTIDEITYNWGNNLAVDIDTI